MPALSQWADQIERRIQAAPEVIAVGPRPLGHRKLLLSGLVSAAALLVWAVHPAAHPTAVPGLPTVAVSALSQAATAHFKAVTVTDLGVTLLPVARPMAPHEASPAPSKAAAPAQAQGSTVQIAQKLLSEKGELSSFMALAVTVEAYAKTPYWDNGGLNVGVGFCVTRRIKEEGADRVRADFTAAGLAPADIITLMGHDRKAQKNITLSEGQAVALLRQVAPDYEARARAFVGAGTFNALPSNRQAALTWLAYNTGPNLEQFNHLRTAVQSNHPEQALSHLTPNYRDQGGSLVPNHRAGAYLAAAYWSEVGLASAITHSDHFEALVSSTADPVKLGEKMGTPVSVTRARSLGQAAGPAKAPAAPAAPPTRRHSLAS
jgi:hypothetical protein